MIYPWQLSMKLTTYLAGNGVKRKKRFPLVLMLEPLFRCNLACSGCGRIREYKDILDQMLDLNECMAAVDECGAPVVSLTGGEPLIHPAISEIVNGIISRKKFLHLCTNGLLLENSLPEFKPSPYFSFVVHLDGLAATHDGITGRKGTFATAIAGIEAAKKAGFQVRTNTTIYKETNPDEIQELWQKLSQTGVDGVMVSPAFSYEDVNNDVFLSKKQFAENFQGISRMRRRFRFYNTPLYLDFLAGKKELYCVPWSTPTRNVKGWKSPCYLITDRHYPSYQELMDQTPWGKYGAGHDTRCANCMVHCGFEGSALNVARRNPVDLWRMFRWNLLGH